jgi:hypothetical protein
VEDLFGLARQKFERLLQEKDKLAEHGVRVNVLVKGPSHKKNNAGAHIRTYSIGITRYFVENDFSKRLSVDISKFSLPGVDVVITIFCDFRQFSVKKWRFFLKKNKVMINFCTI